MRVSGKTYVRFYDHIACRYYDALMKWCFLPLGGERRVREQLLSSVPLGSGGRVLDMCCGTGTLSRAVAEKFGQRGLVAAIDVSRGQLAVARRRHSLPNVVFSVMDATATSFGDGWFDLVIIAHALHEMDRDTRRAVLGEAHRVLRCGGRVAVLEMDRAQGLLRRLLLGFFWFYWLPFNFETATRRDMLRRGVVTEVREAGFGSVSKLPMYRGALQVVVGVKSS